MIMNLAVHGRSLAKCKAEAVYDPNAKWTARCCIGTETVVSVHGHNSIDEVLEALNESLAKHGLSVYQPDRPSEQ